jgi:cellulose synthase/poly-beta-1,6-N-acetylglucosamine synthase-like glycosyltransferase
LSRSGRDSDAPAGHADSATLAVRLHEQLRRRGEPYRIAFVSEPTCWTEAPETQKTLATQRRRWERGLGETLWRHKRMLWNLRYGVVGMLALPYFLIFEFLGAVVEVFGIVIVIVAVLLDAVSLSFLFAFMLVSTLVWIHLSFSGILLEEYAIRRYTRGMISRGSSSTHCWRRSGTAR